MWQAIGPSSPGQN
jgi:WD40 repeat protein